MPYDNEGNWIEEEEESDSPVAVADEEEKELTPEEEEAQEPKVSEESSTPEPEDKQTDIGEYIRRARLGGIGSGALGANSPYPEGEGTGALGPVNPPGTTPGQELYKPGEKMQAYKAAIEQEPLHQNYHPSKWRSVLSTIAGIGSGIAFGPEAGKSVQSTIRDSPYRRQLEDYQQSLGVKGKEAQLEAGGNQAARQYYLDLAKVSHENAQSQAEVARRSAEGQRGTYYGARAKRTEYDMTPAGQAASIALKQAGRVNAPGATYTVKDIAGKTHTVVLNPGGGLKDVVDGTLLPKEQIDPSTLKKTGATTGTLHPVQHPNGQVTYETTENAVGQTAPKTADEEAAKVRAGELASERHQSHLDKSYQFHTTELDKIAKPIQDYTSRLSRLEDTINQGTIQADALVAPELLSVMAGGQGSGVRMNEAEIARILGGRTAEDSLKVVLSKLATDPKDAEGISPAQRDQVRAMLKVVRQKINDKNKALSDAGNDILNSTDELGHRKALNSVRQKLEKIDAGNLEGASDKDMVPAQIPGQPPGMIHRAQIANFKKKYPTAIVGQ